MRAFGIVCLLLACCASAEQDQPGRLPIRDMHLHARHANYAGADPPPMCAPFAVMPRSDAADPGDLAFAVDPPCENPILPATTDDAVMRETIAVMERRNIIGMISDN